MRCAMMVMPVVVLMMTTLCSSWSQTLLSTHVIAVAFELAVARHRNKHGRGIMTMALGWNRAAFKATATRDIADALGVSPSTICVVDVRALEGRSQVAGVLLCLVILPLTDGRRFDPTVLAHRLDGMARDPDGALHQQPSTRRATHSQILGPVRF